MDGQEKRLLKDVIKSLRATEDVQPLDSKTIVKCAAGLAKERGITKTSKEARRQLKQFPETERYIMKYVRKLLGVELSSQENKIGNHRAPPAWVQSPAANHTQQVDAENHVAERDSAQLHSQKENKLPTSQEPAVTTVTKKRKRDVIKQSIQEKAQAVEESKAKKTAEPAKQARKKKPEKMTFGRLSWKEDKDRTDVKAGVFSKAEDEALLAAVRDYADRHNLSKDDLSWVSNLATVKKATDQRYKTQALCEIGAVLPERKLVAIRARLLRLTHHGNNRGQWTEDEKRKVLELHKVLGNDWTKIGECMDRMADGCRSMIRELTTVAEVHEGPWTREENKETGKGIFRVGNTRDGIDWEVVSRDIGTRTPKQCVVKWYKCVRPSMKDAGEWGEGQDHELLKELLARKPMSELDIAWGNLIEGRSRLIARERWGMMRSKIPGSRRLELNQQIMYLIARFNPKLLRSADKSGPYGVSAENAEAAAAAKATGTIAEQSKFADRIAAAAQ